MKEKNKATIYAILAAALYAINVPLSKFMVKNTIELQHTRTGDSENHSNEHEISEHIHAHVV